MTMLDKERNYSQEIKKTRLQKRLLPHLSQDFCSKFGDSRLWVERNEDVVIEGGAHSQHSSLQQTPHLLRFGADGGIIPDKGLQQIHQAAGL